MWQLLLLMWQLQIFWTLTRMMPGSKRKEANAENVAGGMWGPWLRAAVRGLYPTAERGDVTAIEGKTNYALEAEKAWVTRVETHAQQAYKTLHCRVCNRFSGFVG